MQLKSYCDRCSFSRLTFQMKYRIMQFHNMLDDSKSQSRTTGLFGSAFINTVKPLKNTFLLVFWNPDTIVCHRKHRLSFFIVHTHVHLTTFIIITDRILTQIFHKFRNHAPVCPQHTGHAFIIQRYIPFLCIHLQIFHTGTGYLIQIHLFKTQQAVFPAVQLGKPDDIIDKRKKPRRILLDFLCKTGLLFRIYHMVFDLSAPHTRKLQ